MSRKQSIFGFLRFYGQSRIKIDECIEKLKPFASGLQKVSYHKLTKSMNMFVPQTDNVEVHLHFDTKENLEAFFYNPETLRIYHRYSSSGPNQGAVLRKPKDVAWAA